MPLLLACSGRCVHFGMLHAHWFGWLMFAVTAALTLVLTLRGLAARRFFQVGMAWLCLGTHPGWWVSAYMGDCGMSRSWGSGIWTAGLVALTVGLNWMRPFGELRPKVRGAAAAASGLLVLVVAVVYPLVTGALDPGLQECRSRSDRFARLPGEGD